MNQKYTDKKVKEYFTNSRLYNCSTKKGNVHQKDPIILSFIKGRE